MSNLNKRIITSLFLFIILVTSIYNVKILGIVLTLILFQIIHEFNFILNKIFKNKNNSLHFVSLLIILVYLFFVFFYIWLNFAGFFDDKILLLVIITTCISSDIGGYVFGKIFKGKKLTKISPKKTYSGMIGSYILSTIIVIFIFNKFIEFEKLIYFSIVASTLSQLGDLLISFLKRKAKLKDTALILPGHGGILDRMDGMIISIPLTSLIIKLI